MRSLLKLKETTMQLNISVSAAKTKTEKYNTTKELVEKAIHNAKETVLVLEKQKSNPTVAPNYYSAQGALAAYEAVLDALNGSYTRIKLGM